MPSKSKKQHDFMAAVANNPEFAKKAGVPQSVGKEFTTMDKKMKKYMSGGRTMMEEPRKRRGPSSRPRVGRNRDMERLEDEADAARRRDLERDRRMEEREFGPGAGMPSMMKKGGKVSSAKKEAKAAVKAHEARMHKGTKKMVAGGKVRGAGMASKGVRPCKMM